MSGRFQQQVVWITGASSGIGEALVHAFAQQDACVVLSARREEELQRVAKEAGLNHTNSLILPFDLQDTSKAEEYVGNIINRFGRIDVLVNNGGLSQRSEAIETALSIDRQLMEINYFSAIVLTKSVLPYMLKQGSGQLIIISSIAGKFGFYLRSSYAAAKHALHGFYESLRLETEKKGIKTLIVCPGKIRTNISLGAITADGKAHNRMDESHLDAMSANACALHILEAVKQGREELLVGGKELKAVWLKRFLPGVFGKIIRKQSPY